MKESSFWGMKDVMLHEDDCLEIRTYRQTGNKEARVLCVDVNGITVLRVGGLKAVPEVIQE